MTRRGRASFDDVLEEAQARGLAEADPTSDIDGIDSAHKLAHPDRARVRRARRAFDGHPHRGHPPRRAQIDIAFARELGYAIKLLAIAKRRTATRSRRASIRR